MSEENRIAILAGAGLCADAGLPMSSDLVKNLKGTLFELSNSSDGSVAGLRSREQASRWLELFRFLNGGIRFQEGTLNGDPDAPVNIEQVAIAAEGLQARARNPLAPYASGWHHRLQDLERVQPDLLESFVDFIYTQLREWLTLKKTEAARYVARLADLCLDGRGLDIFSLNYDLAIETSLGWARKDYTNGFNKQGEWDAENLRQECLIRLFKLHGSLDWVEDEVYGLCSLQFPRHPHAETIQGDETRPLLIFGTAHKLTAKEPFLTLAYHFAQRVLRTPALAVVGYGFADEYVNQIIEQGIKKNPQLRILIVSPTATQHIKTQPLLDGYPRVKAIDEGAQAALNNGSLFEEIKRILEEASSEKPFD